MVEEVAPGVYAIEHRVAEGKNGAVVGSRTALAIDTGTDQEEGQAVAAAIRAGGGVPDRLVLTHGHGDHILGSGVFRGAEVYAHVGTPGVMRRDLPGLAERYGRSVADLSIAIAWPTVTFRDELWLDLGGKTVHLFPSPGHSADGISAYVVEDRVLFGSDAVVTGIVPALWDGNSARLIATLRQLQELEIAVLVPGHGPVVRGAAAAREALAWAECYLTRLRDFAADELSTGRDPLDVVSAADYLTFVGDRFPPERHGMRKRHCDTVQNIVRELGGQTSGR